MKEFITYMTIKKNKMRKFNALKNTVRFGKGNNMMRLTPVKEMRLIEPT